MKNIIIILIITLSTNILVAQKQRTYSFNTFTMISSEYGSKEEIANNNITIIENKDKSCHIQINDASGEIITYKILLRGEEFNISGQKMMAHKILE